MFQTIRKLTRCENEKFTAKGDLRSLPSFHLSHQPRDPRYAQLRTNTLEPPILIRPAKSPLAQSPSLSSLTSRGRFVTCATHCHQTQKGDSFNSRRHFETDRNPSMQIQRSGWIRLEHGYIHDYNGATTGARAVLGQCMWELETEPAYIH